MSNAERIWRDIKVGTIVTVVITALSFYGVTMVSVITWWSSHLDRWLGLKP